MMVFGVRSSIYIAAIAVSALLLQRAEAGDMGPTVKSFGRWEIHRSQDAMTDKVACLGLLKNNPKVQLTDKRLFIGVTGVPEGFRYRIDDGPPSEMTPTNETLRRIRAIDLSSGFTTLKSGHRLRVSVLTYGEMIEMDLDITGISLAADFISTARECH